MSRSQRPEQEFGSDSFLDVIANIVGILIILIVVVGVKVARQPVQKADAIPPAVITDPDLPTTPEPAIIDEDLPEVQRLSTTLAELESTEENQKQELSLIGTRLNDLNQQVSSVSAGIELQKLRAASLEQNEKRSEKQKVSAESEQQRLKGLLTLTQRKLEEANKESLDAAQQLTSLTEQSDQLEQELQKTLVETQQLQSKLTEIQTVNAPKDRLEHRLSPIGEKVEEGEIHFRIEGGRISHIPLEELLERLKAQIQARRSSVVRFSRYEGSVGPVHGYNMTYLVERDRMNTMESLEYGSTGFRVSVSRWVIKPDATLQSEPVVDAVRPGSRFRQIIDVAAPGSAVTFWIYPDSFTDFPPLREVAHGLQLRVAARPLPAGTPIIGSPGGSKSTAQ